MRTTDTPPPAPDTPVWMQPWQHGNCKVCGHRLWAPQSQELGLCAAHHPKGTTR